MVGRPDGLSRISPNIGHFTLFMGRNRPESKRKLISLPCLEREDDDGERPPWTLVHLESWVTR